MASACRPTPRSRHRTRGWRRRPARSPTRSIGAPTAARRRRAHPRDGEDRLDEQHHRGGKRRQPRQRGRNEQPPHHLRDEGERQQPQMRLPADRDREPRVEGRAQQRPGRHAQGGIEQRSRRRNQAHGSTHETQSGRWRSRSPRRRRAPPRPPASSRTRRSCARPDVRATPSSTTPIMATVRSTRTFAMPHPGRQRDEYDLNVRNDGAEPGADESDRLVPQVEIEGEQRARCRTRADARGGYDRRGRGWQTR